MFSKNNYGMAFEQSEEGKICFIVSLRGREFEESDPVFTAGSDSMVDERSPNRWQLTEHIVNGLNAVLKTHGLLLDAYATSDTAR